MCRRRGAEAPWATISPYKLRGPLADGKTSCLLSKTERGQGVFHFCKSSLSSSTKAWRKWNDHQSHILHLFNFYKYHLPPPPPLAKMFSQIPFPLNLSSLFHALAFSWLWKILLGFARGQNIFGMSGFQVWLMIILFFFFGIDHCESKSQPRFKEKKWTLPLMGGTARIYREGELLATILGDCVLQFFFFTLLFYFLF